MPWLDDLVTLIEDSGAASLGVDLFKHSRSAIPSAGDGPFTLLVATGGTAPDWTQNRVGVAYQHPGVSITVRGTSPNAVYAKAMAIYNAITTHNRLINGTWYRSIQPTQEPTDNGPEPTTNRARFSFNAIGDKRPDS